MKYLLITAALITFLGIAGIVRAEVSSVINVETSGTDTHVRVEQNIRARSQTSITTSSAAKIQEQAEEKIRIRKEELEKKKTEIKDKLERRAVIEKVKVTELGGTYLVVETAGKTVKVLVTEDTSIYRRFFGSSEISEIKVGHEVTVYGLWTDDSQSELTARFIRDYSIQIRYGVFVGTVTGISGSVLTIETVHRGIQTADLFGSPVLVNRKMETIKLSDIAVGHRIRVKGMWDRSTNTITEVKQVKDYSLPEIDFQKEESI